MEIHRLLPVVALALLTTLPAIAGESLLRTIYLPLLIDADPIEVTPVVCLQWSSSSAGHTMDLINVRYVPPSDAPEHSKDDINAASVYGVKFSHSDPGTGDYSLLLMDLSGFSAPGGSDSFKTSIVRACLESLRLCICNGGFRNTPLTFKCADADRDWVTKLVAEFNAHDRQRPFLTLAQASLTGGNPAAPDPAKDDPPHWTYSASAGGSGGEEANYFYFETFSPTPAFPDTGTLASVTRVRAVYALSQDGPIRVVDYSIGIDSIGIKIQHAGRKDHVAVICGKNVAFVTDDDFRISGQENAGYLTTDKKKTLTAQQRECADNLILILAMRRSPTR